MLVLLVDVAKGAGSVLAGPALFSPAQEHAEALAGLAAIVGHIYPVWLRFVGGKGVAVAFGVFSILAPLSTAVAAGVFVAATWITRYVSLGSILATVTLPALEWTRGAPERRRAWPRRARRLLILFRHRGNIARLVRGTERRLGQRAAVSP